MCQTLGSEQGTHNPALVALAAWCWDSWCQVPALARVGFPREKCERAGWDRGAVGQTTSLEPNRLVLQLCDQMI